MYTWRANLTSGSDTTETELAGVGLGQEFADLTDAEQWLSEFWSDLADLQVISVTLLRDDQTVYTMDLASQE